MRRIALAGLLVGMGLAAPSGALGYSAELIVRACTDADAAKRAMCSGYITGIAQTLMVTNTILVDGARFCPPPDLSLEQAFTVIHDFAMDREDLIDEDAVVVGGRALQSAYPCP